MKKSERYKIIILVFLLLALPFIMSSPKAISENFRPLLNDGPNITILNYHKVYNMKIALSVSPEEFEQQMSYLKSEGYTTISPKDLMDFMELDKELPDKPLLITFDDGYVDNYLNAYPVMKKYGFTGTIFIVTDFISSDERFLTWDQVKELKENGFYIGSHTMQHIPMTDVNDEILRNELLGSAAALDYHLGKDDYFIAYPTGAYNSHVEKIVKECGYRAAFTIQYGNVNKASNPYALERIPIFKSDKTFRSFCLRVNLTSFFQRMGLIRS